MITPEQAKKLHLFFTGVVDAILGKAYDYSKDQFLYCEGRRTGKNLRQYLFTSVERRERFGR